MAAVEKKRKRVPKEREKKSWVWNYFEKDKEKGKEKKEGVCYVKCKVADCENPSLKVVRSTTTGMMHHLGGQHGIYKPGDANNAGGGEMEVEEEPNVPTKVFTAEMQELIDSKLCALRSFLLFLLTIYFASSRSFKVFISLLRVTVLWLSLK